MLELDIVDEKTGQKGKVTQNQAFKNMAMGGAIFFFFYCSQPAGALDL